MQLDEVTAVIEVKLSFVLSFSVGPSAQLTSDKLKDVLLRHVQSHLDAAGGLQREHIEAHAIIELRDTNIDQALISN